METKLLTTTKDDLKAAAAILRAGGLVAIPTETVYGLGANGLDEAAVAKIFEAKGRPQDNPLILHIAEAAQLSDYCRDIPDSAWRLAERFWPGPLTMVLPAADVVPKRTTANLDTVAMRCPALEATREIIRLAGVPVAAPSANLSGKPSTTTAAHVAHDMDGKIDAIVDGGPCRVGVESTIVDLSGARPRLLRPGGVTPEELIGVLGDLEIDKAVTAQIAQDAVVRAPGMKYKHYAPAAEVVIVAGSRENAADYIRRNFTAGNAVLCFEEELPLYAELNPTAYGRESDPMTLCAGLFAALRRLDTPEITRIFARCPEGGGVAYAVQNRLKKSAGFHIVDADDRDQGVGGGVLDAPSDTPLPCHSEEQRDEESSSNDEKILRSAQNDMKSPCRVIGITGPSGAGKTTALHVLRELGAAVYDCDAIYHELLLSDRQLLADIDRAFPNTVQNGALDRKALAATVFADPEALARLNAVSHPAVRRELERRLAAERPRLAAIDAIGLFEGGLAPLCDVTFAVVAPEKTRIARLTARDGISEQAAKARVRAQKSAEEFTALCDRTLYNDGTPEEFEALCRNSFSEYIMDIP